MSEVLKTIQDRITVIDSKVASNDNVKDYVEELDFLRSLLGKMMLQDQGVDPSLLLDAGTIVDVFGGYAREIPVFVYNCVPGTDSLYRFSRLSSFQFNKEKKSIELFYSGSDENSYEDY
jgi:hypothetical protein